MKKTKKKKYRITKFEKVLYAFAIILLLMAPISIVFTKSALSEINSKEKTNEGLEMKINELVSLDNIKNVIKAEGLSYNNDNIKNID